RTPTRSRTRCASRCRRCGSGSASRGSSRPFRVWGTASTPGRPRTLMARPAGLSARAKLTLSYTGFVLLAGVALLAVVWLFLLRYVPPEAIRTLDGGFVPGRGDLIRAFLPALGWAVLFLLVV